MPRKTTGRNRRLRGASERGEGKRPERAFRQPEEHWRSLLENIPDTVVTLDRDGTILFINRTAPGFAEEDVVGTSAFDYLPPEHHDTVKQGLKRVFEAGEVDRYEIPGPGPFGRTSWYLSRVGPVMRDGKVIAAAVIATDVTEQKRAEDALRESEEKWRSLIENAPDIVASVDSDGRILSTNRTVPGITEDDVVGHPVFDFMPADHHGPMRQALQQVFQTGKPAHFEAAGLGPLGTTSWYETRIGPVILDGKVTAATLIATDVTARRRAEQELRKSEQRYRDIVEDINEIIYELDPSGRITYMSPAVEHLSGFAPSEMTGRHFSEFIHPDDVSNLVRSFQQDQTDLIERANEYRTISKSGETIWIRSHGRLVLEGGRVVGYRGILVDISERRQAEEALRESEERFRSAFQHAATGIALVTPGGRLLQVNRACWETLGYSEQELTSTTWQALTHADDLETTQGHVRRVLAGESDFFELEKRFMHKDGRVMWGHVISSLVRDSDGTPSYFITQIQDITERKHTEHALRQSEAKFRTLAETTPVVTCILQDMRMRYVSPAVETLTGYSSEELLEMDFLEVVHPDYRELVRERGPARQRGEQSPQGYEIKIVTKSGDERWLALAGSAIEFEGKPAVVGTGLDVTERKRAEEALKQREETTLALLNAPTDPALLIDKHGTILALNEAAAEALGGTVDDLVGVCGFDLFPTDVAARRRKKVDEAVRSGKPLLFEDERDGRRFSNSFYPVAGAAGEVERLAIFAVDITERRRAQEALRESETKFRELVENINETMYEVDASGRITYMSPVAQETGDYGLSEFAGRPFADFIHPDDRARVQESFDKTLRGQSEPVEFRLLTRSGTARWHRSFARQVRKDGRVVGMRGVLTDINASKTIRGAVSRAGREHQRRHLPVGRKRTHNLYQPRGRRG
jgi:PAS domain S-box-containing protein